MRIGCLTTSFPTAPNDYAGRFVLELVSSLADRGHRIEVLAPEPVRPAESPQLGADIRVRWVPYLRPRSWQRLFHGAGAPDNLVSDPLAWPGLMTFGPCLWHAARNLAHGWDAVMTHWALPCGLIGGRLAPSVPHLAVFHSADVWALERLPSYVTGAILSTATAAWYTSLGARAAMEARCHQPPMARVGPMGVSRPRRSRPPGPPSSPLRVLSLGRLVPIKGLDLALNAAALGGIELTIAGDGPREAFLRRQARGLPVRFVGRVSGDRKEEELCRSDVLLIPSRVLASGRREGTPVVALEAAVRGVPVIASRSGGLAELDWVRHPPWLDARSLHGALMALSEPAAHARAAEAALRGASPLVWERLAPEIEGLLRAPCNAPPREADS